MKLRLGKCSLNNRHSRQQEWPFMSFSFIPLSEVLKTKQNKTNQNQTRGSMFI